MSAFQDIHDEQEAQDVELSHNVAEDYVQYHRGNAVGHEEEGWLMYLSTLTGWVNDKGCHNNVIGQGPPGSGKSLTKNIVSDILDDRDTYTKTDASSNAILDSVEWDLALAAPLDELDKIDKAIVEVLKSSNPEDDGYSKDRNVEDSDARGGYSPTEVSADANPWITLYAPSSKKGGINDELEDRALILYFSNDKHTRRGIGRKEFGHEDIDLAADAYDHEYIYDTHALAARLRERVRTLPVENHYEEDDEGGEYLASRTGDTHIYMPEWVFYACEPIFNVDEDHTNRVYGLVKNLIQASALLNHDRRTKTNIEVYVDEDSSETKQREAVVVASQDVANVLVCLPTLLSTTHQLTPLKRHVLDAVDATEPITDGDGTTVQDVRDWLSDNDIPHPKENTLRQKLNELAENYYLHKWESAGGKRGTANVYEKRDEGALKVPRLYNLDDVAKRIDGLDLPVDDCVDIDPSDPFDGCTDPIRDQPFYETIEQFEAKFSSESTTATTEAADYMGGDPHDSENQHGRSSDESDSDPHGDAGGQASLTDVSSDGVEASSDGESGSVDLEPDGKPENPTQQYVYDNIETDTTFGPQDGVANFIGCINPQTKSVKEDTSDTAVDPEHELWQNRPDMTDDRVMNDLDAISELEDAYKELQSRDLIAEDESQGPPAMYQLCKAEL